MTPRQLTPLLLLTLRAVETSSFLLDRDTRLPLPKVNQSPTIVGSRTAGNLGSRPVQDRALVRGGDDVQRANKRRIPEVALATSSSTTERVSDDLAASYALIWSKGFLSKFSATTAALVFLHLTGVSGRVGLTLSHVWHAQIAGTFQGVLSSVVPNLLLPLLSSSCCLLQLVINALVGAGGCAGYNTLLGPLRPIFLAILAYLNVLQNPSTVQGTIRLSLALLPEAVDLWNRWLVRLSKKRSESMPLENKLVATLEIDIPTMGCVACINKIDSSLRQNDRVLEASSWLEYGEEKGGRAKIRVAVDSEEEMDSLNEGFLKKIDAAGFPGSRVRSVIKE